MVSKKEAMKKMLKAKVKEAADKKEDMKKGGKETKADMAEDKADGQGGPGKYSFMKGKK